MSQPCTDADALRCRQHTGSGRFRRARFVLNAATGWRLPLDALSRLFHALMAVSRQSCANHVVPSLSATSAAAAKAAIAFHWKNCDWSW